MKRRKTMKKIISSLLAVTCIFGALAFTGCSKKNNKTITVGASSTPHAVILEQCKPLLQEKGYTLDIKVYDDYVLPNTATEDGDLDANYFQHKPYLDDFNKNNNTHLVSVAAIHYEPFGIYAGTSKSLSELPEGAKIAIPNDGSNEARALFLLEANGLITLKKGTGFTATKQDIEDDHGYDIIEMTAAVIPTSLDSVNIAVINGNYAIGAGLKVENALATEDKNSEAAKTYANILVVKEGHENDEGIKALKEVLQSETIRKYINDTFGGAVVPIF